MATYRDGAKVATHLFEAAAWQYAIRATCRGCRHASIFDPHALWWLFQRKGWDDRLKAAASRFRCIRCGKTGADLVLVREMPTVATLPLPPENEWKRAISRFRS